MFVINTLEQIPFISVIFCDLAGVPLFTIKSYLANAAVDKGLKKVFCCHLHIIFPKLAKNSISDRPNATNYKI